MTSLHSELITRRVASRRATRVKDLVASKVVSRACLVRRPSSLDMDSTMCRRWAGMTASDWSESTIGDNSVATIVTPRSGVVCSLSAHYRAEAAIDVPGPACPGSDRRAGFQHVRRAPRPLSACGRR